LQKGPALPLAASSRPWFVGVKNIFCLVMAEFSGTIIFFDGPGALKEAGVAYFGFAALR